MPFTGPVASTVSTYVPAGVGFVGGRFDTATGGVFMHPDNPIAPNASTTLSTPPSFLRRGNANSINPASTTPPPVRRQSGRTGGASFATRYANSDSDVVPLVAVELSTTGLLENEYPTAVELGVPIANVTLPVNPLSALTVSSTAGATVPEAVVTVAAAGVSVKSGFVAAATVS